MFSYPMGTLLDLVAMKNRMIQMNLTIWNLVHITPIRSTLLSYDRTSLKSHKNNLILTLILLGLRGNYTFSEAATLFKLFCLPFKRGSTLKGKNLLPL